MQLRGEERLIGTNVYVTRTSMLDRHAVSPDDRLMYMTFTNIRRAHFHGTITKPQTPVVSLRKVCVLVQIISPSTPNPDLRSHALSPQIRPAACKRASQNAKDAGSRDADISTRLYDAIHTRDRGQGPAQPIDAAAYAISIAAASTSLGAYWGLSTVHSACGQ